jgi:hypothetical protein
MPFASIQVPLDSQNAWRGRTPCRQHEWLLARETDGTRAPTRTVLGRSAPSTVPSRHMPAGRRPNFAATGASLDRLVPPSSSPFFENRPDFPRFDQVTRRNRRDRRVRGRAVLRRLTIFDRSSRGQTKMRRRDVLAGLAATSLFAGIHGVGTVPTPGASASARPASRVRPGDPEWPSDAAWEELNRQVEGRLMKVQSPLIACVVSGLLA